MNASRAAFATLLTGLLIAATGCSSTAPQPAAGNAGVYGGAGGSGGTTVEPGAKPAYASIYFDYRQSSLDSSDTAVLDSWAAHFKAKPDTKASLEGHGDERGSNATNMALGEARAASVRSYLIRAGVSGDRLSIKSYGESRPVAKGHDESAWVQNRRVEIVLR